VLLCVKLVDREGGSAEKHGERRGGKVGERKSTNKTRGKET